MSKRFRVAFSFSADSRQFVGRVARILANRFGADRIFYDEYHQAELARADLALYLSEVYEQADLVVVVFRKGYETKEWVGLEWGEIYQSLKLAEPQREKVLLLRFDHVESAGLYGLSGFVDIDQRTPEQVASLILERLALTEGHSADRYLSSDDFLHDWPAVAPPLEWVVANQRNTLDSFERLITRASPFRLLLIEGGSETGKSHLSKQFLRNALRIPQLTCARFDFKGALDVDFELRAFAEQLGVPPPTSGAAVASQLRETFSALVRAARPTLLIFDTFEHIGAAAQWVLDDLLLRVVSAPWLRVIILGQRVPHPSGEPWAEDSRIVRLLPPTAEEWYAFARAHNASPELTFELVQKVHQVTNGKSSVLAQILRPVG